MKILVVDDEEPLRDLLTRKLKRLEHTVYSAASGEEALALLPNLDVELFLLDISMPGMSGVELLRHLRDQGQTGEAVMLTGHATVNTAIEAMKLGAYDYLEKPIKFQTLLRVLQKAFEKFKLARENRVLRDELRRSSPDPTIIGESKPIMQVKDLISRVARTNSSVLIEGPSGTGKELVARAIHEQSPRAERSFVAINCGALNETLLENELFGHIKGAFTGAMQEQEGLFAAADRGTLFIDEVCEMGPSIQKKFLRVLENGEYMRLGEARVRQVDVRILAATNKDVTAEVESGNFREDLYYRLNVLHIAVPTLRERKSDIPLLVQHFLTHRPAITGMRFAIDDRAMLMLRDYAWPGNIRELANLLERAQILCRNTTLGVSDFPNLRPNSSSAHSGATESTLGGDGGAVDAGTLEDIECRHIDRTLKRCNGNKTLAARALGISLRSLYRKLEKFKLA